MKNLLRQSAAPFLLWSLLACQPSASIEPLAMNDALKQDIAELQSKRIFFGHQSVGGNIIEGVEDLLASSGKQLNLIEAGVDADTAAPLPSNFLLHMPIGKNSEPKTKCDDFRRMIDQELAGKVDVALLKFCYVDIDDNSDVDALFAYYRSVLDGLKARHPDITFIHVTAALRHSEGGFGVWIRETLGKPNRSKLANIKRNQFNDMLRETYAEDPIFDLAASESTYPDGRRETFEYDGKTSYGMIGAYTYDGGHLNEAGRQYVAAAFIQSIARSAATDAAVATRQ